MDTSRGSALRVLALCLAAFAADALSAADAPAAVSSRPCRVVNVTQGRHFPPDQGESLATAFALTNPEDQLEITGICTGTYTLDRNLSVIGIPTKQFPVPALNGGQAGSTLTVSAGVTATLTNLTITGGTGTGDPFQLSPLLGGGILNRGSLTLTSCAVTGNSARSNGNGGGIFNTGTLILRGASIVSGNVSANDGGGIYNGGSVTVSESSSINGNSAADFGGGIANVGALLLDASTVTANQAGDLGGGIFNSVAGTVTVQNSSRVNDNTTIAGGGILNLGRLIVNSSAISGNTAAGSGGGGINNGFFSGVVSIVTLTSATVSGNHGTNGGGIYNEDGTVTLTSSLVTENTAVLSGGGIYNNTGVVNLDSSSVTANIPDDCVGLSGC